MAGGDRRGLPGWQLHVRFNDGLEGMVEMKRVVHAPDAGVFAELADPERFAAVYVDFEAVTWPGEIDLARMPCTPRSKRRSDWCSNGRQPVAILAGFPDPPGNSPVSGLVSVAAPTGPGPQR